PVVGFLANGLTYFSGEREVATAFATVNRSSALADASRDFKSAIASMRIIVKDFVAAPSSDLAVDFERMHGLAVISLNTIADSIEGQRTENIVDFRKDVTDL